LIDECKLDKYKINSVKLNEYVYNIKEDISKLNQVFEKNNSFNLDKKIVTMYFQNWANRLHDPLLISSHIQKDIYREYFNIKYKDIKNDELYACIGFGTGIFWSMPIDCYKIILKEYKSDNILECFGSSFNHYFAKYCSLIDDSKSKGNFFAYRLLSKYKCLVVNPPFTYAIITKTIFKLYSYIETLIDIDCFIFLPMWDDIIDFIRQFFSNVVIYYVEDSFAYDYYTKRNIVNNIKQVLVFLSSNKINSYKIAIAKSVAYRMSKLSLQ
jgi:hypothetical protein